YDHSGGLVGLDASGLVRRVGYPDHTSDALTYEGRDLTEVRNTDGTYWRCDEDGWNHYDAEDHRTEHLDGEVTAASDGTISVLSHDGAGYSTYVNGGVTETTADGLALHHDREGRLAGIDYPNERSFEIEYDETGTRSGLIAPNGAEWVREDDGWSEYGPDGAWVRDANSLEVADDGEVRITADDGSLLYDRSGA